MYGPKGMKRSGFGAFTAAAKLAQQEAADAAATGTPEATASTTAVVPPADAVPAPNVATNGAAKPAERPRG